MQGVEGLHSRLRTPSFAIGVPDEDGCGVCGDAWFVRCPAPWCVSREKRYGEGKRVSEMVNGKAMVLYSGAMPDIQSVKLLVEMSLEELDETFADALLAVLPEGRPLFGKSAEYFSRWEMK